MLSDNPSTPLILVVEDDNSHAELLRRSIADAPEEYRLEIVGSIRDARIATDRTPPSLVLTDYRLPDGNGDGLIVLAAGSWPVIMMTSHGSEKAAVEAMKFGARDYIVKSPESLENLPSTIRYALTTWSLLVARRRSDEAALRAKRDWERTFDAVPDLIAIIDLDHTITRVNKAMAERCGVSPQELVGRKCYEVVHGLSAPLASCPHTRLILDGYVHQEEIEEPGCNGIFDVSVSPLTDDEGCITASVHVMRDITSHRLAEKALRESEENHRRLANEQRIILNTSSVGICFLKNRKIDWTNPAFDRMFGYQPGTTYEMDMERLYADSETYEYIGNTGYQSIESGEIFSQDIMMKKKDGTLIWCNLVGQAVTPGNPEDGSIWVVLDITERKQVARLLAENEIRLRTLVHTIPDLVWLKDVEGVYLACNRIFERFFGAREADIVGKTDYDFVESELADFFREHDRKAMAAGGPSSNEEWITFADNGQRALLETIKTPMCDSDGQLIGVLGIARDITERRQAEENKLELERKFQQTQKLESLGVLAGGIAHDFNNVLTIILGHCYIVDEEIDSGIDVKYHVKQVQMAAERAAELCRQMLSYAGKNTLVQTRINLCMLVDENQKMLRSAIRKNVHFDLDLANDVPEIVGDSAQIQQVVMNLIINAAEAIGDKNGTIRIALNTLTVPADRTDTDILGNAILPGNYACLTVSDNGCGMDVETQKRIFEPFYTTKFTGRGLGMSAVLGIIKSHNGALQLSSTPGVGSAFKVFLPWSGVSNKAESVPTVSHDPVAKGSGTILLVDDEEALLIIGAVLLKAMGYSVITAINGHEALEIFRERGSRIDLILLDLIMPEMSGVEAYRLFRDLSLNIPIVICSGFSDEEFKIGIEGDEFAAVVNKPYKPDQLQHMLMKLLDKTG